MPTTTTIPTTMLDKLEAKAAEWEQKAIGLRQAVAELRDEARGKKQARGIGGVIDQAIALRAAASAEHSNGKSPDHTDHTDHTERGGRKWSPAQLAKFRRSIKKTNARKRKLEALGVARAAPAAAKKKPGKPYGQKRHAARLESARLLAAFDHDEPRTAAGAGLNRAEGRRIGTFVRHGYLKAKGDGLVLTAHEFVP